METVLVLGLACGELKGKRFSGECPGSSENRWNMAGWWLSHPSEKYESQLGLLFPIYIYIYGKIKNVPNHQPVEMFKGQKCPVWRSWNMSCSIVSSYSTKIHDTNLLGNRTWSLEICQNPSIGFEGKASINRKLIVYTIELLEGKSLTIMFRASVPLLVAPRCIKPHFCCRLVGWLSTQKKGTTL